MSSQLLYRPVCLAVWLIAGYAAEAQYTFNRAIQFTRENGLPVQFIRVVQTGDDGFIWMGSEEGLCRFDGQQFKVWKHDPANPRSLASDRIAAILPEKNRIWVGTSQGISVLDVRSDTFTNYRLDAQGKTAALAPNFDYVISALYKDADGDIWIGTRSCGVWKYIPEQDNFYQYPFSRETYPALVPALGSAETILNVEAHDSTVWVGTTAGLQEINKRDGRVRWYTFPQPNKEYQVNLNAFRRLCYHADGKLYTGSWEAGVNVFDQVTKTLHPLPLRSKTGRELLASPVARIISKNAYELWITTASGFVIYHTGRQEIIFSKKNNAASGEFYGAESIDPEGRAWQTTVYGIQCFDPLMQQFATFSYEHLRDNDWGFAFYIIPDKSGNLLTVCPRICTGIYEFDKQKQSWASFPFPKGRHLTVRGFARKSDGLYIIAADEGLFTWLPGRPLKPFPPIAGLHYRRWGDVRVARDGKIWLCAFDEGLVCLEPGKSGPRIFGIEALGGTAPGGMHHFSNLYEDSWGNIWFSRNNGYGVHLAARDTVLNFIFGSAAYNTATVISSFAEDRLGRVWMNCNNDWLGFAEIMHPEKGLIHKVTMADLGITGRIYQLASDGNVWGYTDQELLRINADDLSISHFNFRYGVRYVDFYHISVLPSGELLFGGRNEIVLAQPGNLQRNREVPIPYVSEIQVLNRPYPYHDPSGNEVLHLKHRENFFSIGFSAKAFTLGNEVQYRYRLSGFDDWTEAGSRRFANYTNVPGGEYVFQLQAANNEGIWNETLLEMPVIVDTVWWATWWFRLATAITAGALLYGIYFFRVTQIRRKARLKADYEKKLANVEMSALLSQMNPHFLFNSLNSIDSYIIRNESKQASEYLNNFARLMRLILQHSRSEYISLADELETLDLYLQMESLRFDHRFRYEIAVEESLRTSAVVIPPMLLQPYLENAIWHGLMHKKDGSEANLLLKISRENDRLHCVIEDNGIGRERSKAIKAAKPGNNHKKSMGMRITRDRLDLLNRLRNVDARVEITDLQDETGQARGTRVELTIPV